MRKMGIFLFLIFFSLGCNGICTIEDSEEIAIRQALQNFVHACKQKKWKLAYGYLSQKWRAKKSLEEFQENMEKEGMKHLRDFRILSLQKLQDKGEVRFKVLIAHKGAYGKEERDYFMMVEEKDGWKLIGVEGVNPPKPTQKSKQGKNKEAKEPGSENGKNKETNKKRRK